jgi:hypothetical protein
MSSQGALPENTTTSGVVAVHVLDGRHGVLLANDWQPMPMYWDNISSQRRRAGVGITSFGKLAW